MEDLQGHINENRSPYAQKNIVTQIHDFTTFVSLKNSLYDVHSFVWRMKLIY